MKKPLNFINYSNETYNLISNNNVTGEIEGRKSMFEDFLQRRIDYESQIPQYKDAK